MFAGNRKGQKDSVAGDEAFVTLMQVAREDDAVKDQLLAVLSLDPFNRKSALNTLIEQMRLQGAPVAFVAAVANLLDDGVALRALELLQGS